MPTAPLKADLEYLALEKLAVSTENVRAQESTEDQATWDEFKADIKEHGILQPLLVEANGDGAYAVLEGRRRLLALQEIYGNREGKIVQGAPAVPCEVVTSKMDALTRLLVSSSGNLHRLDLNPQEWAGVIKKLKDMGKKQEEIARLLHKSKAWVSMAKEGKPWSAHKSTTSKKLPSVPTSTEFEDGECPACGNVLSIKLVDGAIVLEVVGKKNAAEKKHAAATKPKPKATKKPKAESTTGMGAEDEEGA